MASVAKTQRKAPPEYTGPCRCDEIKDDGYEVICRGCHKYLEAQKSTKGGFNALNDIMGFNIYVVGPRMPEIEEPPKADTTASWCQPPYISAIYRDGGELGARMPEIEEPIDPLDIIELAYPPYKNDY